MILLRVLIHCDSHLFSLLWRRWESAFIFFFLSFMFSACADPFIYSVTVEVLIRHILLFFVYMRLLFFFSSWHCRNYDAMLNVINNWAPILPQWITDNIKQQLILPRLQVSSNRNWNLSGTIYLGTGMCASKGRDSVMYVLSGLQLSMFLEEGASLSF